MVSQKPGELAIGIVVGEVVGHRIFSRDLDPGRNHFCKKGPASVGGGNRNDQRVENRAAHIGMIGIHREQRGGMRGNKAVIDRERGNQR